MAIWRNVAWGICGGGAAYVGMCLNPITPPLWIGLVLYFGGMVAALYLDARLQRRGY